jgi:hypothetical protein
MARGSPRRDPVHDDRLEVESLQLVCQPALLVEGEERGLEDQASR